MREGGSVAHESPSVLAEGEFLHSLARRLFPITRSITGDGVRQTLEILSEYLPGLEVHEVPSGTPAFDWTVPREWAIRDAYIEDPAGKRIIDLRDSNLHVVSYSTHVDATMPLADLDSHLHSLPDQPDAIPYVTSYYNPTWGFCLTDRQRQELVDGNYRVLIDSDLFNGSLTYGELVLPGHSNKEVFISTYVCHPSLANNELSGPLISTALAMWLASLPDRRFTYRFVFVPETIGALTYASQNLKDLKDHVIAGFNLTCIGDDGDYSYLASRLGDTRVDAIGRHVVSLTERPVYYTYLDRGSDERTYCAPGIDLPLISLMRTRYGNYPEYHTSLDDLSVVTPTGLQGGLNLVRDCIEILEHDALYCSTVLGEPQLGRRGMYHRMHSKTVADVILLRTHVLAYCDGQHSLFDIATLLKRPFADVLSVAEELLEHGLLAPVDAATHG